MVPWGVGSYERDTYSIRWTMKELLPHSLEASCRHKYFIRPQSYFCIIKLTFDEGLVVHEVVCYLLRILCESAFSQDHTVWLCPRPYGGPRGGRGFLMRKVPLYANCLEPRHEWPGGSRVCPKSQLRSPPGRLWRDKWTALTSGPLSRPDSTIAHLAAAAAKTTREEAKLAARAKAVEQGGDTSFDSLWCEEGASIEMDGLHIEGGGALLVWEAPRVERDHDPVLRSQSSPVHRVIERERREGGRGESSPVHRLNFEGSIV